jgi:hypothetical protein
MTAKAKTTATPKRLRGNWKPRFLAALAETSLVTEAAKRAGVSRGSAYRARQEDEDFALAWADVEEAGTEQLEKIAVKRASEGSDVLLIFLLKSRRPERYRDNVRVEHSGTVRHDVTDLTDPELEDLVGHLDTD